MKKLSFISVILIIGYISAYSQSCLPEGILFTTQAQIDSFQINYPNCSEIEGHLIIGDWTTTDITNLDALNVLTSVGGNLRIGSYYTDPMPGGLGCWGNPFLDDISGLSNLANIGGDLSIHCNDALTNLLGLESLTTIGGSLNIGYAQDDETGLQLAGNPSLTNITALESVSSIGGDITIAGNISLSSLSGLGNIEANSIENITIKFNNSLSICEVQSICEYLSDPVGVVEIYNNATGCNNPAEIANTCGFQIPCLPYGNYYFTSQAEVDSFQSYYSGCINLHGNVTIWERENSTITNLSGLSELNSIEGDLWIGGNKSLASLSGMDGVHTIGGDLTIGDSWIEVNPSLVDLTGFEGLNLLGGELAISGNNSLISLQGIENIDAGTIQSITIAGNSSLSICDIQSICDYLANPNGYVGIGGNAPGCNSEYQVLALCGNTAYLPEGIDFTTQAQIDSFQINYPNCRIILGNVKIQGDDIENLNGLNGLTSCYEDLVIQNNTSLINLSGLDSLISIGGHLSINNNDILIDFIGLNNLTSLDGNLSIQANDTLTSLVGLDNLTSLEGNLVINNNNSLTSFTGLDKVASIRGVFWIEDNDALTSLSGLDNVTSIGGSFWIVDNDALISLTGLENFNDVGDFLVIIDNNELISLSGIDNINTYSIVNIGIINNESLSTCNVKSICDYLEAPGGVIVIEENATGCNSEEEVEEACAQSENEIPNINNLSIYPNPCSGASHLRYSNFELRNSKFELYSIDGVLVKTLVDEMQQAGEYELDFDVGDLSGGLYLLRLQMGDTYVIRKLVLIK